MRSVRHELASVAVALALPVAVAVSFPYGAVGFGAAPCPPKPACMAFVVLSAAEERAALRAAKTSWQVSASGERRMRVRLPLGDLPEEKLGPSVAFGDMAPRPELPVVRYDVSPWVPSCAAGAAAEMAPSAPVRKEPVFSREELLKVAP